MRFVKEGFPFIAARPTRPRAAAEGAPTALQPGVAEWTPAVARALSSACPRAASQAVPERELPCRAGCAQSHRSASGCEEQRAPNAVAGQPRPADPFSSGLPGYGTHIGSIDSAAIHTQTDPAETAQPAQSR